MEMTKIDPTKFYSQTRIAADSLADAEFLSNGNRKAVRIYSAWSCSIGDSQEGTRNDKEIVAWINR